jgi:hypothetical protein
MQLVGKHVTIKEGIVETIPVKLFEILFCTEKIRKMPGIWANYFWHLRLETSCYSIGILSTIGI